MLSSSNHDAANPVLHGMSSYLQTLTVSLQNRNEIPFPTNSPLYNLRASATGGGGVVLPVRFALIGVVTCPDDQWHNRSALSNGGVYRLPSLTASTRLSALQWAFDKERVQLPPKIAQRLPFLAASAVWARGPLFRRIARQVRSSLLANRGDSSTASDEVVAATMPVVESAFALVGQSAGGTVGCNVEFLAAEEETITGRGVDELFGGSVGGNQEAKMALEEALALDMQRRKFLSSCGLSPPTGILLYGAPGTGKTLLAKAVARLLRSQSASAASIGGAFISLSSTDIVRAEVGTGEKMVVSAFETARMNSPSVVFIDEFQALFTERSSGGSGRLSTTLLQCMDDIKRWRDIDRERQAAQDNVGDVGETDILVLAATNTPWMVDSAFLRPGRFDRSIHFDLPDLVERKSILSIHVGRMTTDFGDDPSRLSQVCERIAEATHGCTGADLAALCRAAAVRCLIEQSDCVHEKHFVEVMDDGFKASSDNELVHRIKSWRP